MDGKPFRTCVARSMSVFAARFAKVGKGVSVTRPIRERFPPVVVGGVGGGGTRVVAQILDALGFRMRPVSIPSLDNVLFTSFFTLPAIAAAPRSFDELAAFFIEREQWWDIFEDAARGRG